MKRGTFLGWSVWLWVALVGQVFAQNHITVPAPKPAEKSYQAGLFGANLGYFVPYSDMASRFGSNGSLGASFFLKTRKNWLFGLEGNYMFGTTIKENTLNILQTSSGNIIGNNGNFADVNVFERGMQLPVLHVGKIFPMDKVSLNSGLMFSGGVGYLMHWIHIQDISRSVPLLNKENRQGFDRLTNGPQLNVAVGWFNLRKRGWWNFICKLEIAHAFTKERRFDYNTMGINHSIRQDGMVGIKLYWFIPRREKEADEYYYY